MSGQFVDASIFEDGRWLVTHTDREYRGQAVSQTEAANAVAGVILRLKSELNDVEYAGDCHCGEPVDTSELRDRGMCTHCDDVRCDAYPGACGR